jgi:hypothetical protein
MKRFRDVEHLVRLALLFGLGLLVFVLVRAAFVPKDFGRYGHFRASSIDDARVAPTVYAGRGRCVECHEDTATAMAPARHKTIGCEACHGPLAKHSDDPEVKVVRLAGLKDCVRCHEAAAGKPPQYPMVDVAAHSDPEPCINCHDPHDLRDKER